MIKRSRDYNLGFLLLAASAVLATVLLFQWLHFRGKDSSLNKLLTSKLEVRMEPQKDEVQHVGLPGLEDYPATVERPLFMEGRRPATEEAGQQEVAPIEKKPLTVKLMGVVFAPTETLGLFLDAQGKYKRLRVNDSIGGWKVAGIEFDKVIMEQDGSREELKLAKPKSKKGTGPMKPGGPSPAAGLPVPGQPLPGQPMPGQPMPGQPLQGQPIPPFGAVNPNNPNFPEQPIDPEQPNEPVDETAIPPEEPPNGQ